MADGVIIIPPPSSGPNVDVSTITRVDDTVVNRQRVAIGDPTDPAGLMSLREVVVQRQAAELNSVTNQELFINGFMSRGRERPFTMDARGGSTGRGNIR